MRLVLTNTLPKNFKTSCTAASSVVPLISMGAICYAYECKYSERNMCFLSCRLLFEPH